MLTLPSFTLRLARAGEVIALLSVCLVVACATAGGADTEKEAKKPHQDFKKEAAQEAVKKEAPKKEVTKEAPRAGTLGAAVRALGEQGDNLVLMKGLEDQKIDRKLLEKLEPAQAAEELARTVNAAVQTNEAYSFLYLNRQPYDALAGISLAGRLDPSYRDMKTTVAFGAGTKLFTALALFGQALNRAFVVDNSLAETPCGELALKDAPVESALEAILKSSRVLGFGLDSTDEFVFLSGDTAPPPRSALLNAGKLNDAQRAALDKRVNVHLPVDPKTPSRISMDVGAEGLNTAAEALSSQLGLPVEFEPALKNLPVNPVVMPNVRIGTALDLIIRQWPVRDFGYEVQSKRILIRRRIATDAPPAP